MSLSLLAETSSAGSAAGGLVVSVLYVAVVVAFIVGLWKLFVKAGEAGWAAIVPFYNQYVLLKIAGRPAWWLLLYFVPLVNVWVSLVVGGDIAERFGHSRLFGNVVCGLLGVGYVILGFNSSTYSNAPRA